MRETYRKRGRMVRWENGTIVRAVESGVAVEDGEVFRCSPDVLPSVATDDSGGQLEATRVVTTAEAIRELVAAHPIERLLVTAGEAEHDCDGRQWRDAHERIHLALLRGRMRVLIDLASFALDDVARIAAVLHRADDVEREAPDRLRLVPSVAAALIPSLADGALANVTVVQRGGGIDGRGLPIEEGPGPWTNHYRPSYRFRPVRMPMNLAAMAGSTAIDESLPAAVALLEPVRGLTLRVLVDDGTQAWPATVRVTRIAAIAADTTFYPYGAGSFGGEMML